MFSAKANDFIILMIFNTYKLPKFFGYYRKKCFDNKEKEIYSLLLHFIFLDNVNTALLNISENKNEIAKRILFRFLLYFLFSDSEYIFYIWLKFQIKFQLVQFSGDLNVNKRYFIKLNIEYLMSKTNFFFIQNTVLLN